MAAMSQQGAGRRPSSEASPASEPLAERLARIGREIGAREREHAASLAQAEEVARALHARVAAALDSFHRAAAEAGAPHLRVDMEVPRADDKHLRSVQFELLRGRHRAIVTVKSRGEVTLVGPFRAGKVEGPCKSFPIGADAEIDTALGGFLEQFLAEAATP
jgi:hypothetical protein